MTATTSRVDVESHHVFFYTTAVLLTASALALILGATKRTVLGF
jgi:hypothetical protein